MPSIPPNYLEEYEQRYQTDPRDAAQEWFKNAKYGLFLHYGLYSLLGNHEWVQYHKQIEPAEYAQLQDYFLAENFDAKRIVEFAIESGMNYINLTSKHHDGFCLFDSDYTTYTSAEAPAGRDLVGELANACQDAGIGLFLYYSHGYDWHHPHAPNREEWGDPVRPDYDNQPKYYAEEGHDLEIYLEYVEAQIEELLTNYGPIAGIWLDPSFLPQQDPERFAKAFSLRSLYEKIREIQPHTLISYKEGVTGTEDFTAPEHETDTDSQIGEVCTTMIPGEEYRDEPTMKWGDNIENAENHTPVSTSWGYAKAAKGMHRNPDEVWDKLTEVLGEGYNFLLNTGPLPDGQLDPEDVNTMQQVGDRIKKKGFPIQHEGEK